MAPRSYRPSRISEVGWSISYSDVQRDDASTPVAFFTESYQCGVTYGDTLRSGTNVKMAPKVASFTLPLCTTINMNGCAAFILTTVLYVAMSHGMVFSPMELILWIFIATLAAVGNAGVPMGCYFLASAFIAAMDVPMTIMGIIFRSIL